MDQGPIAPGRRPAPAHGFVAGAALSWASQLLFAEFGRLTSGGHRQAVKPQVSNHGVSQNRVVDHPAVSRWARFSQALHGLGGMPLLVGVVEEGGEGLVEG